MRTVFNSASEVIHLFCQRSQNNGRCSNVFFEGDKIYSYGRHYLLGEFITNGKGDTAIMINDHGYSTTTSKHICALKYGASQYKRFYTTTTDKESVLNELKSLFDKLAIARKPEIYIDRANSIFSAYSDFCNWKGLKIDKDIKKIASLFNGAKIAENIEKRKAQIIKDRKAKEKKEKQQIKTALNNFFNYKANSVYLTKDDYCRISKNGLFVETTKGVKVDIQDAKKLYQLIKMGKDIKGHKIGYYTVISLNGVLKIGCHNINTENMKQIGEKILSI